MLQLLEKKDIYSNFAHYLDKIKISNEMSISKYSIEENVSMRIT